MKIGAARYTLSALFHTIREGRPPRPHPTLSPENMKEGRIDMTPQETLREVAALRHSFHANQRLRLEFLASVSKLLRDYGIQASDELLGSLIVSVPEEVLNGHHNGNGAQASSERMSPPPDPPHSPDRVAVPPATGDRSAVPPASPGRTYPPPVSPDRSAQPPASADRSALPPSPATRSAVPPAPADRSAMPPAPADRSALPPRSPSE